MEIRLAVFLSAFVIFSILETLFPKYPRKYSRSQRWPQQFGLSIINSIIANLSIAGLPVLIAQYSHSRHWGFLGILNLEFWQEIIISYLCLDLLIYCQHAIFHSLPNLWRLHQVHHSDLDLDSSSGIRFHPLEILISIIIKSTAIIALGAPVEAVIYFEIILNACSLFHHSNLAIPPKISHYLSFLIVTPQMHRTHHSSNKVETDSNFCFSLSIWDHIFGTFVNTEPKAIGLDYKQDNLSLKNLILMPLKNHKNKHPEEPR